MPEDVRICNAIIQKTTLTNDEHGCLGAWLFLDYGGSGQGFGGWSLYLPQSFAYHKLESVAGHFLYRVLEIAGVIKWEDLIGRTIRVKCSHSKVHAIGHIVKDDWFEPSKDFAQCKEPL